MIYQYDVLYSSSRTYAYYPTGDEAPIKGIIVLLVSLGNL